MDLANLVDGPSAAIVFGGTFVGTVLRCGRHDGAETLRALGQLGRRGFEGERVRAELAQQVQEIRRDGILRAQPHAFGDREFDEATGAMLERRSVGALLAAHDAHKSRRQARSHAAVRTLAQATELAPVFGLAGTLVSLSQLPASGIGAGSYAATIAMAVLSTLYGLLAANLLLGPLARMLARAAEQEEAERQQVIDWLAEQVAAACEGAPNRVAAA